MNVNKQIKKQAMKKFNILITIVIISCSVCNAQGVGIGDKNFDINPSAIFELQSSNKGFLVPRMTESERTKIRVNAQSVGLIVYQKDKSKGVWYYNGLSWQHLATSAELLLSGDDPEQSILAVVATTGNYEDLVNKPVIKTRLRDFIADTLFSTITAEQRERWNKAIERGYFSGSYKDLENTPEIPVRIEDLEQDANYYTTVSRAEREIWNAKAEKNDVLVLLSDFISDTAYYTLVTSAEKSAWNIAATRNVFSGDYKDIKEKPALQTVALTGNFKDLYNRPQSFSIYTPDGKSLELSIVAITGNYEDLVDKPQLTDNNGEALQFATVATTGSYLDLDNKIDNEIPAMLQELAQDDKYYTTVSREERERWSSKADSSEIKKHLKDLESSDDYNTVSNNDRARWNYAAARNFSGDYKDVNNKPVFAEVAETGSFHHLSGAPTITDYRNILRLDTVAFSGNYDQIKHRPFIPVRIADLEEELQFRSTKTEEKRKWDTAAEQFNRHKEHFIFSGNFDDLVNKPVLATVAFTGSYEDILNKISISGIKDSIKLATVAYTGDYKDLNIKATGAQLQSILSLSKIAYTDSFYNSDGTPVLLNAPKPATTMYPSLYTTDDNLPDNLSTGTNASQYARADHVHSFVIPERIKNFVFDANNINNTSLITARAFNTMLLSVTGDIKFERWSSGNYAYTYAARISDNITISAKNTVVQKTTAMQQNSNAIVSLGILQDSTNKFVSDFNKRINATYDTIASKDDINDVIPVGTVVMWDGTSATEKDLPPCWEIISGAMNTPVEDPAFAGRFPVGTTASTAAPYKAGNTGGRNSVVLTKDNFPAHSHIVSGKKSETVNNSNSEVKMGFDVSDLDMDRTGTAVTTITGQGLAHENRPRYYAIYFIKKTSNECN
jgi:hypothetical protein